MRITVDDIARATGGAFTAMSGATAVTGVSVDTRTISPGDAFFALKGPNFDGHEFVAEAEKKGAACCVVSTEASVGVKDRRAVMVDDTLTALGDLATWVRARHNVPVVAVGGSAGKTTTKEMIYSILSRSRKTLKTPGNKNNLIGLPLTLFGLAPEHGAAVVELGISEPWEMERLVAVARPDVAVLTNIGRGHLATLGTLEGVAMAKGPLFTATGPECVRVVNLDDPWVVSLAASRVVASGAGRVIEGGAAAHLGPEWETGGKEVTYSIEGDSDVSVTAVRVLDDLEGLSVVFDVLGEEVPVRMKSPAVCNVANAAAAIAATLPLGATTDDIVEGLSTYAGPDGRMEVKRLAGLTVLDDTYNANPDSVDEALKTLRTARGRKVAVLGEMLELGQEADGSHVEAGRLAAEIGVDVLVAVGAHAAELKSGAEAGGMDSGRIHEYADNAGVIAALKKLVRPGDSVLVKGSRGARLEEVVRGLTGLKPGK